MTNESYETCFSKTVLKIISTHTQPIYGSKPSTAPPQPPSSAPRNVKVTWSISRQKRGFKSFPLDWILRLPAISEWRSWNNFHYTTHPQDALSQLSTRETNGVGSHSGPKKPELSPKPRDVSPKPEVIFFDHRDESRFKFQWVVSPQGQPVRKPPRQLDGYVGFANLPNQVTCFVNWPEAP